MIESGNTLMTGFLALGLAWLFIRADSQTATSRALSVALALAGLAIFSRLAVIKLGAVASLPWWLGCLSLPGSGAFIAAFEWTYRVRRTLPAGALNTRFGDSAIRIAQALVVIYALGAVTNPQPWARQFMPGFGGDTTAWSGEVLLLFVAPLTVALLLWTASMLLCLNRRPDPPERVRLVAVMLATTLLASSLALPLEAAPVATTLGFFILLAGAMRHAQLLGRRGQFMSRFLSPQVASLVNREGLQGALRETCQALSVVCVDLRGFTAFAGAHDSEQVLKLLREYYDEVGQATAAVEGTIKDYAGDGVLVLIGAPVSFDDHAERAMRLAVDIRARVSAITERWHDTAYPLGVGMGVASGAVTVGIVGGDERLEYAAVGQAVNLASRLCDHARDGEIVLAEATAELLALPDDRAALARRAPMQLKGFAEPVDSFAWLMHA